MSSPSPTVGSFLFDYLHSLGVKHAFGIPGDFALPTFRWLDRSPIDLITMTHEPSVGFAADAYGRINGLGVACVTYCVGGLNMLNPTACAYAEKSPMLVISGGPSPKERHTDALIHHKVRTFDTQRRIFEEVTCANTALTDAETAAAEIMRVVETVMAESRPGYIEVPFDLVDEPIKPAVIKNRPAPQSDPEMLEACIEEAAEFINSAKQPVILAGIELHRFGIADKAVELARAFNIPIAATLDSKSVIRETNPLYLGVYSHALSDPKCKEYVENSDCVILLGTFISDVFFGFAPYKLDRRNSILVTTEKARVRMHGFDNVLLGDFIDGLTSAQVSKREEFVNPNPAKLIKPLEDADRSKQLTVDSMFAILEQHMDEGATMTCDVGESLFGAIGVRTGKRRNFLADAYYLSMGFAVPAAIGAMAGREEDEGRVFAIVGDGAFQMTGIELSTAAKYGMAPIVIIMNNEGYGTQRHILDGSFNNIHTWNYTKLTDMLGYGKSVRVATNGELDKALAEAVSDPDTMYLIEAMIPKGDSSQSLKRLGENLAAQRDSNKRQA